MIPVGYCSHLTFTADSSQLALITKQRNQNAIEVYDVPSGELVRRVPLPGGDPLSCWSNQLVHLGDAVVHMEMRAGQSPRQWKVVRHQAPDWEREILLEFAEEHQVLIAPVLDGFVIVRGWDFVFGDADGSLREPVRHPDLADTEVTLLAADLVSGRMALVVNKPGTWQGQDQLMFISHDLEILARERIEFDIHHGWFSGPDLLVTLGQWKIMKSWQLTGETLGHVGGRHLDKWEHRYDVHMPPLGTTPLPLRNVVAVERDYNSPLWLDAVTCDDTEPPPFAAKFPVWVSPNGRYLVFEERDHLELTADPAFTPGDVEPDRP